MQPCKTGDQSYSDASPYSECSLICAAATERCLLETRMLLAVVKGQRTMVTPIKVVIVGVKDWCLFDRLWRQLYQAMMRTPTRVTAPLPIKNDSIYLVLCQEMDIVRAFLAFILYNFARMVFFHSSLTAI